MSSLHVCQIEKSKSSSLKGHPPPRSFSAAVSTRDTFYLYTCRVKRVLWWCRFVLFHCCAASAMFIITSGFPKFVFINIHLMLICQCFLLFSTLNQSIADAFIHIFPALKNCVNDKKAQMEKKQNNV